MLATRSEGVSSLLQQKALVDVGGPLKAEEGVATAAFPRSAFKDYALSYVTYFMFHSLCSLVSNCKLYSDGEEWSEILKQIRKGGQPSQVL